MGILKTGVESLAAGCAGGHHGAAWKPPGRFQWRRFCVFKASPGRMTEFARRDIADARGFRYPPRGAAAEERKRLRANGGGRQGMNRGTAGLGLRETILSRLCCHMRPVRPISDCREQKPAQPPAGGRQISASASVPILCWKESVSMAGLTRNCPRRAE
jgi:hypothetical protein